MLWHAIGELLPAGVVIASNPFAIIATVIALNGPFGTRSGIGFLAGWSVGLATLTAAVVVLFSGLATGSSPLWLDLLRLAIGLLLVGLGARTWIGRPRVPEERAVPGWVTSLSLASPGRTAMIGAALAAANPKNIAIVAANASFIAQDGLSAGQSVVAGAVLVALGSSVVATCVLLQQFGGEWGRSAVVALNRFMQDHTDAVLAAVLVLLGVKVVGDALAGFGVP